MPSPITDGAGIVFSGHASGNITVQRHVACRQRRRECSFWWLTCHDIGAVFENTYIYVFFVFQKNMAFYVCIAPCRDHTFKALRYSTRSQGISQFYLHTPHTSANTCV